MRWSEWRESVFGILLANCEDVTTAEVTLNIMDIAGGWEVELYIAFPRGNTDCASVRMHDIDVPLEEAQEHAIAWANGVVEKLGAFLEVKNE